MSATPFRLLAWRELVERASIPEAVPRSNSIPAAETVDAELIVPDHRERAEALYAHRRLLMTAFRDHNDLLLNPAWDMMLDLFRRPDGNSLSAAELLAAKGMSPATARRWLRLLEQRGLVALRSVRSGSGTIVTVSLTDGALALMTEYLDEV